MTDIRKGVENEMRCYREGVSKMGGTPETPCHDAILELYEKLDTLSKSEQARSSREQAAARYLRERGKRATAEGAVAKLIPELDPEPEHDSCEECGTELVLCRMSERYHVACPKGCFSLPARRTEREALELAVRMMRAARGARIPFHGEREDD